MADRIFLRPLINPIMVTNIIATTIGNYSNLTERPG